MTGTISIPAILYVFCLPKVGRNVSKGWNFPVKIFQPLEFF